MEESYPFTRQMYEEWLRSMPPDTKVCDLSPEQNALRHCPIAYFVNHDGLDLHDAVSHTRLLTAFESDGTWERWVHPIWVQVFIDRIDTIRLSQVGGAYPMKYHDFTAAECLEILSYISKEPKDG
jgi:hypothetical protein